MTYLRALADGDSISLSIHVQPKASRTRIAGLHGDAVKLCITSPPVDGKANAAVIQFLAKLFKIPKAARNPCRRRSQPRQTPYSQRNFGGPGRGSAATPSYSIGFSQAACTGRCASHFSPLEICGPSRVHWNI